MLKLVRNQRGQGMVEYILIVVFVVIAGIVVWRSFGQNVSGMVEKSNQKLEGVDVDKIYSGKK
jgi:Flp pilus assembly pilin Flp